MIVEPPIIFPNIRNDNEISGANCEIKLVGFKYLLKKLNF
jgi:hypothetical protein